MASFNRVILMGNLTRNPELRYIGSGTAVVEVGLAVNDRRKNANGEWVEETVFVEVTFWGRTAEVVNEYLSKGSPVFIEGRLKFDSWEGQDGQKRSKLRVVCERMQMVGGKGGGGGGGSSRRDDSEYSQPAEQFDPPPVAAAASATKPQQGDDIPF
jgi:single-strand DNA-binding protein